MCAKFTVDPLSPFRTGVVFTTQKPFPSEIPLTMRTAASFFLNTFSNRITIRQTFKFYMFNVKQIYTRAKKKNQIFELH